MSSPRSPASATRSQATAPTESAPDNAHVHGAETAPVAATATSSSSEATGGEAAGIAITPGENNAGIDVIVVDDTATSPVAPSASPSRSSSRIASRVPTARAKSKRGQTASSVAAGKKKRKAVKATAGTAKVGPSAQLAGTPSAGAAANMSSSLPESETETPAFAHGPAATAPAPKRASTGERTPRRSIVWLGDDYSAAAGASTFSAAAGASTSSAATTSAAILAPAGPTGVPESVPAASAAFCLDTFMEGFSDRLAAPIAQPQSSGPLHPPASAPTHELSMESKLDRLFAMLHELKEQVNATTGPAPTALLWWSGSARFSRDPDSHSLRPDTD
ncbi:hypothetical protein PR003_g3948 [Phytophthora rubi]|uniref:Uncharacterized protein n=1 Tax=Phytophthora rubi TaxID=129364 RepID=A0A6A3NSX7_9STRA|nr:hypothetical protein PR001_g3741 [Phytophthora rubi]KAE9353256.1 hypothetical protein PR003_g3948 [Phytophthora rubi]